VGTWSWQAAAQQDRIKRVVHIVPGAESDQRQQARVTLFRDGLGKLGWHDGQNIRIEDLWAAASPERSKAYVKELVANPPDVVVASTLQAYLAMRRDASFIPMVFTDLPDPVVMGFVSNLAKPDGNFTGFTAYEFVTAGKWLEVVKELAPSVTRVAIVLAKASQLVGENFYHSLQAAAGSLGVETTAIRIDGAADVQAGIDAFALQPNGGLVMAADVSLFSRATVIELAARHGLPAIYPQRNIVTEGGLAFYGIDFLDLDRGASTYVDRILRGAKPADLDSERVAPGKFFDRRHKPREELVVRLDRRAGALGIVRHARCGLNKIPTRASPWTQEVKK
jgi:putative ABC transport system substrate-binding protein